ncbi:MAG: hypothetical protein D3915_13220 [Candidatus Electrothrix sp. AU1_5]|nr:hypothetical protein [Candidatus Electrothrix gigas]
MYFKWLIPAQCEYVVLPAAMVLHIDRSMRVDKSIRKIQEMNIAEKFVKKIQEIYSEKIDPIKELYSRKFSDDLTSL